MFDIQPVRSRNWEIEEEEEEITEEIALDHPVIKNNPFTALESPNLVERLTAALLTHCQVKGIKAISVQNLVESSELSVASVINFEKLSVIHPIFACDSSKLIAPLKKMVQLINRRDDNGIYM
eukprot:gene4255-4965_t